MLFAWQRARDLASLASNGSLFAGSAREKLELLLDELRPLAERYDVVVANPPYMGTSSLGSWMSTWVKKEYPDEKSDLCTSFIERGFTLSRADGASAMITMQSWMFLGSYEKMRGKLLRNHSILSMAHLGTRAFGAIAGEVVSTTATVFNNVASDAPGAYFRLVDMGGESEKREGYLEALANPECGWFYRCDADMFSSVPGRPITYWAPLSVFEAFINADNLGESIDARVGLITGDGNRFLRCWQEVAFETISFGNLPGDKETLKWVPYAKGGDFRLWYGNLEHVVNWENDGWEMKNDNYDGDRIRAHNFNGSQSFKEGITWNSISSSRFHCRYLPTGFLFDAAGPLCEVVSPGSLRLVLGLFSSSTFVYYMQLMNPTMNFPPGYLEKIPFIHGEPVQESRIAVIVDENVEMAKSDWNSFEMSWDFKRHPLA